MVPGHKIPSVLGVFDIVRIRFLMPSATIFSQINIIKLNTLAFFCSLHHVNNAYAENHCSVLWKYDFVQIRILPQMAQYHKVRQHICHCSGHLLPICQIIAHSSFIFDCDSKQLPNTVKVSLKGADIYSFRVTFFFDSVNKFFPGDISAPLQLVYYGNKSF